MMARNPEELSCISIIVCDDIYRDEVSKKLIIVGTFNRITTPRFPCQHERMSVLLTLTNGRGKYDLSVAIEHEGTGEPVAEIRGPLTVQNPLGILDINMQLNKLQFPTAGKYWVTVKADEQIIGQRPISLREKPDSRRTQA